MTLDDLRTRTTITVPETARVLGISRDAAYAAVQRGELPVLKLGRRLLILVPKLLVLIGDRPDEAEGSTPPAVVTADLAHANGESSWSSRWTSTDLASRNLGKPVRRYRLVDRSMVSDEQPPARP